MSRYDALTQFLASQPPERREVRMRFHELESLVGALPPSARQLRTWWGNSTSGQALYWQRAGWKVDTVILTSELVVFVRGEAERRSFAPPIVPALVNRPSATLPAPLHRTPATTDSEADVQARLVTHLASQGWRIERVADTASREHGIDIVATRSGRTLAVEVKGYPSTTYADPWRANDTKPTSPSNQARQWFSHALLKALLMRDEHQTYEIAMGFPDMPTYRRLAAGIAGSLRDLQVQVILVRPGGDVTWLDSDEAEQLEEAVYREPEDG